MKGNSSASPIIYYQNQRGGLCRMQSLNAYFSRSELDVSEFYKWCNKYQDYLKKRYNYINIDIKSYDIFPSNQVHLISYIISQKENIFCLLIPFKKISEIIKEYNYINLKQLLGKSIFFFVFNLSHIWGMRQKDNIWYKVDSIGGVVKCELINIQNDNNIGLIIPRNDINDLTNDINHISSKIINSFLKNKSLVKRYEVWGYCFEFESLFSTLIEMIKHNSKIIINKSLCDKMIKTYEDFSTGFEVRKISLEEFFKNIPIFLDMLKYTIIK